MFKNIIAGAAANLHVKHRAILFRKYTFLRKYLVSYNCYCSKILLPMQAHLTFQKIYFRKYHLYFFLNHCYCSKILLPVQPHLTFQKIYFRKYHLYFLLYNFYCSKILLPMQPQICMLSTGPSINQAQQPLQALAVTIIIIKKSNKTNYKKIQ